MPLMYCLHCKRKTETANETHATSSNGRPMIKGTCLICGGKKSQFVKGSKAKGAKATIAATPRLLAIAKASIATSKQSGEHSLGMSQPLEEENIHDLTLPSIHGLSASLPRHLQPSQRMSLDAMKTM